MHPELCSCPVGLSGAWCKHQATVAAKYKLSTTNQMPKCSPELRHLLHCVATGNASAVQQSFFVSMNEQDERKTTRVTGNAAGETEANGSDVHSANKHGDNTIEGSDAQDGTSPIDAAREEDSNECDELLHRFATFTESMVAKVRKNTEIRYALQRFLDQREKLKTDAALACIRPALLWRGIPDCHYWAHVPEWWVQDLSGSSQLLLQDVASLVGERGLCRLDGLHSMLQPTSTATHC